MELIRGNIFSTDLSQLILPHICNNMGKWGAGFTNALSKFDKNPEK